MHHMRLLAWLGLCLLALPVYTARAENATIAEYTQKADTGIINWITGYASASGTGVPPANSVSLAQARAMAIRAATVDARRNLFGLIRAVQVDAQTTIRDAMEADNSVLEKVRGFLQNSQIVDTAYMSDGSVAVTVGLSLRGGLSSAVLPPGTPFMMARPQLDALTVLPAPGERVIVPQNINGTLPAPSNGNGTVASTFPAFAATGLVLDARGLDARPALSPRVVDENGNEVYSASFAGREPAIQQGLTGYVTSLEQAVASERVGEHPLVLKVLAVRGRGRTDFLISAAAARHLFSQAMGKDFLEMCRVIVVLDE